MVGAEEEDSNETGLVNFQGESLEGGAGQVLDVANEKPSENIQDSVSNDDYDLGPMIPGDAFVMEMDNAEDDEPALE